MNQGTLPGAWESARKGRRVGGRERRSRAERERSRDAGTLFGGHQVSAWEDKDAQEMGGGGTGLNVFNHLTLEIVHLQMGQGIDFMLHVFFHRKQRLKKKWNPQKTLSPHLKKRKLGICPQSFMV